MDRGADEEGRTGGVWARAPARIRNLMRVRERTRCNCDTHRRRPSVSAGGESRRGKWGSRGPADVRDPRGRTPAPCALGAELLNADHASLHGCARAQEKAAFRRENRAERATSRTVKSDRNNEGLASPPRKVTRGFVFGKRARVTFRKVARHSRYQISIASPSRRTRAAF